MHKFLRTWEFFQLIYRKKAALFDCFFVVKKATLIGECCDSVAYIFAMLVISRSFWR